MKRMLLGIAALCAVGAFVLTSCGDLGCPDCKTGKKCGCSCISKSKTCHKADDGSEWFEPGAELVDDEEWTGR